jgi:hypothetical protein
VVGLTELKIAGWSVQKLLNNIRDLDRKLYTNSGHEAIGNTEQWLPIFMNNPATWRAIITERDELAAYWQTAVVNDDLYLGLKAGLSNEGALTASSYKPLTNPGTFNLYFVSICINPAFRKAETSMLVIDSFFGALDDLSRKEIFFNEITGSACSDDGVQICRTFRLDYLHDNAIGKIYSGYVGKVINRFKGPLSARYPSLYEKYSSVGLC